MERSSPASPQRPRAVVQRPLVLVVEDEPGVLQVVAELLRSCGLPVLEACGPAEALALADRPDDPIALLVTDIVMPGMSGLELARRVRALCPGVGVVFMSGFPGDSFDDELLLAPHCRYLRKPFSPAQLLLATRSLLEQRGEREWQFGARSPGEL